uniref:Putative cellulose synthase-like protein E6 isoform X1 n=1 Tax=Davidia involucrata TaxID=16924 RepID=A0A5B7B305_DAVIN
MGKDAPLFETMGAKGRIPYQVYAVSVFLGICLICVYRVSHLPAAGDHQLGRWAWIGSFMAELWFSFYWIITQFVRWNPIYRYTFKHRLSQRYEEVLPGVDIFVCTADPVLEPPIMVINTVLSVMAYDYPPQKLSIYLSDDGGSEITFYALLQASRFSKHWLPFCKKYRVQPRSPAVYFSTTTVAQPFHDPLMATHWSSIKKLYEDMKKRIDNITELGQISDELRQEHRGFREWDLVSSKRDHQTILQILIDGRDPKVVDADDEGQPLPTLVYLAREKRPQYHHNFKAGALNALIRVSSRISNGPIILNVDCDMYSNNSESVRDALCFFMDEEKGHEIGYVQYPQNFDNITKNEVYSNSLRVTFELELAGFDSHGGPCYIGTGCFHRRGTLCGNKYNKDSKVIDYWKTDQNDTIKVKERRTELEEICRVLASCSYEENTEWGKEMGLKYGCPVEDVITGLSIQCRGWKSIYFNPERKGFVGVAPTTLVQTLVQHKRWSEGDFQIFFSKYCPFVYGHGKIPLRLQASYCCYLLWAPNCLPTLFYVSVPSLCILRGISLFPKLSSLWILPFAYVTVAKYGYSLGEFLWFKGTFQGWWNNQRMWVFKRSTSYLFGFTAIILKSLGFGSSGFVVTAKVAADEEVSERYEKEVMEFGGEDGASPMFNIIATLALINLFCFVGGVLKFTDTKTEVLAPQILLCGLLVLINLPIYQGLFFRKDKGRMPTSITCQSVILAIFAHLIALN